MRTSNYLQTLIMVVETQTKLNTKNIIFMVSNVSLSLLYTSVLQDFTQENFRNFWKQEQMQLIG